MSEPPEHPQQQPSWQPPGQPPPAWPSPQPYPPPYPQPYPPYGQQPPSTFPTPPPAPPGTNRIAIAAMVTAVLATACFASVALSIIALVQTSRTRQKGFNLAAGALVLSIVWIVGGSAAAIAVGVHEDRQHRAQAIERALADSELADWHALARGDCLVLARMDDPETYLPRVPCSTEHDNQVIAVRDAAGTTYPGDDAVSDQAEDLCGDVFDEEVDDDGVDLDFFYPSEEGWRAGDRTVVCLASSYDLKKGSVLD